MSATLTASRPVWGAWIEICFVLLVVFTVRSRPVWGAWIEMPVWGFQLPIRSQSRPVWGAWIEIDQRQQLEQ